MPNNTYIPPRFIEKPDPVVLVNMLYEEEETGHILYQVPKEKEDQARHAVLLGYNNWKKYELEPDSDSSIESYIEKALRDADIPFTILDYEPIDFLM